jgi:hypothetical protein
LATPNPDTTRRRFVDRWIGRTLPRVVEDFTPPPRELAPGVLVFDRKVQMPGFSLGARSVAIRLASGELWLWSPFRLDPPMREALEREGGPQHLVAPNSFHYLYLRNHLDLWPRARVWLAPLLRERRPELPPGETLGETAPEAWRGEIDQCVFGPWRGLSEVAFVHRPTRTLLLADTCFNIASADTRREEWFWRLNRHWRRFGPSATARVVMLRDRATVRDFAARVLERDFDRIVVAHGEVLESGGHEAFRQAFARWLAPR